MKSIKSLKNLEGKRVLLRLDLNVPIEKNKITSTFKIEQSLKTIKFLRDKGASIIIISHLGRKGDTLLPVSKHLAKHIKFTFVKDEIGTKALFEQINKMKSKDVILLENIRIYKGEESGDKNFAQCLAEYADVYVNDAFAVSHRDHSSIVGVAKILPSYAGFQLEEETKNLSLALKPKHPFLVILGGSKTETKMPIVNRFIKNADTVFIGGILANNFFKFQGKEIGKSIHDEKIKIPKNVLNSKKLLLPWTVVLENGEEVNINQINKNDRISDIGVASILELEPLIKEAKLILWNGPMGWYESGYKKGTDVLINLLLKAKCHVVIGGGDTALFMKNKKISKNVFISTGGGATLEFLSKGTLSGIKALK